MALAHAKISPPLLPWALPRERLFKKLDESLSFPLTWVHAPAGSGKTTLLASYLQIRSRPTIWYRIDERDRDIQTFLSSLEMAIQLQGQETSSFAFNSPAKSLNSAMMPRTAIEQYFSTLQNSSILIFEDFDEIADAPLVEELFLQAVLALPAGISMVITSRRAAPARFARFKAKQQMAELSWRDLRLNLDETGGLLSRQGRPWPPEMVAAVQEEIDGWPTGVTLLSLYSITSEDDFTSLRQLGKRKELLDYFASEVFSHFSWEDRAFLLKTAFLPNMTAELARQVTGERDSEKILTWLHTHGYFTERLTGNVDVYRYHPLFREFLIRTALDTLTTKDISLLQHTTARVLEETGAIDDAVEILGNNGSWETLIRLVHRNAERFIRAGNVETVRRWLNRIPRQIAETVAIYHYWQGCCSMIDRPADALSCFTRTFELAEGRDLPLTLRAWCGAVNALLMAWDDLTPLDRWISWFDGFSSTNHEFPSREMEGEVATAMLWALTSRQPHHPGLHSWLKRVQEICLRRDDCHQLLQAWVVAANYYCWIGDKVELNIALTELEKLINREDPQNTLVLSAVWLEGVASAWMEADAAKTRARAREGLNLAEATGCHYLDHLFHATLAYGHLLDGETRQAGAALDNMGKCLNGQNRHAFAHYHYLRVWRALLDGDWHAATSNSCQAVRLAHETGMVFAEILCRMAHCRAMHETGNDEDAWQELAMATSLVNPIGSPLLQSMCHLLEALLAYDAEDMGRFRAFAGRGFGNMRKQGYVSQFWWWIPDDMSRLCSAALEEGIETGFVTGLIRRHGLLPSQRTLRGEKWPWLVKVYTLGRFNVIVEDVALSFPGKSQAKPLTMLQAIIALGGRGVAQEQLIECLWPDAEGDVGHQSFATTLHRLRKLLVHEQAILLKDGKVTLNPRYCWVDAWTFERIASRLLDDHSPTNPDHDALVKQAERLLSLYKGPFLGTDQSHVWAISLRERLRSRLLRVVLRVAVRLEESSPDRAIRFYELGIETDQFIEEFYQGLMRCLAQQGRKGEVHSIYCRCRSVLKAIDATPSLFTDSLYQKVIAAG